MSATDHIVDVYPDEEIRTEDQFDPDRVSTDIRLGDCIRIPDLGVEIDREAVSPKGGVIWFEYKGSLQGRRPGLLRTDTRCIYDPDQVRRLGRL